LKSVLLICFESRWFQHLRPPVAKDTVDEWVDELLAAKHLAAKLGQGDITKDEYAAEATYAFGRMVRQVLGLGEHAS